MRVNTKWSLLILAVSVWVQSAGAQSVALDPDGRLYTLTDGLYGELFPGGGESISADTRVLAIDILGEDGEQRLLVPGSLDVALGPSSSIFLDQVSKRLFVLLVTTADSEPSALRLVGLHQAAEGEWFGDVVDVAGLGGRLALSPEVVSTQPEGVAKDEVVDLSTARAVFHLFWLEGADQSMAALYSPLVVVDGEYQASRVVRLSGEPLGSRSVSEGSLDRPAFLGRGRDPRCVVMGTADREQDRLVTFQSCVLPRGLDDIAEKARGHWLLSGHRYKRNPVGAANDVRGFIKSMEGQVALHAGVLSYLADEAYDLILSEGEGDLEEVGDLLRSGLLSSGASFLHQAFGSVVPDGGCVLVQLDETIDQPRGEPSHHVEICEVTSWTLPEVDSESPELIVSENGRRALISWVDEDEGKLLYRRTLDQTELDADWSRVLTASRSLEDLEAAKKNLRRLIRSD